MSNPSLPGTPGTGPVPEPEAEGFREEQVEAEKQRLIDEQTEALERSKEAKDFYAGKGETEEPPPITPGAESRSTKDATKDSPKDHRPPSKGSSTHR